MNSDLVDDVERAKKIQRNSHIWEREEFEHYVEPSWCSRRLFQEVKFDGIIHDPCCGFGTIPEAAMDANLSITCADIVDRGYPKAARCDFLGDDHLVDNVVANPPFNQFRDFAEHALMLTDRKVALLWTVRTLAAARWLEKTPLRQVLLLSPRPSMPPGHVIAAGGKPGGGTQDFCWLVWDCSLLGLPLFPTPKLKWLRRDP